ncbi:MAG: hypothetical protein P8N02_06145, partial [Actinomycetota bacterium]|nr:hypothetical protein [Actinomycetota bacterium]
MSGLWRQHIDDASAWTPAEVQRDRSWEYELTGAQAAELVRAAEKVFDAGLALEEIDRSNVEVPSLDALLASIG